MSVRIGTGVSGAADPVVAAIGAVGDALPHLEDRPVSLAVVFLSGIPTQTPGVVLELIEGIASPGCLIGCCAEGVLGDGRELERGNAVAVWLAAWGQEARVHPFRIEDIGGLDADIAGSGEARGVLLLADGRGFPVEALLEELWRAAPATPVVGGLASARSPAGESLFLGDELLEAGAVGVTLEGVEMHACVSQGAIPLGREMTVTAAEGNVLIELAGRPALEAVHAAIAELSPRERSLVAGGLLVGLVIDPGKPEFEQGDFLVRGVLGFDRDTGTVSVGARVREGQVIRLHARDAISADEDLCRALALQRQATAGQPPAGSLVFSCQGRGSGMFGAGDHDAATVHREMQQAPSAGFFAAGEIGPVAGRSFLHGFTATLAIFPA